MKAQALSFVAPRRVEVSEVDLPEPGDGDVVVRTMRSGISSGTELLAYRGEIDPALPLDETIGALAGTFAFPFRYGYSCVGQVEQPGGGLDSGTTVFALHPHQDLLVAPASDLVVVDGVDPREATLFPLVETAFQICLDVGAAADEYVVVTGLGAIGLLCSLLLQRTGGRVIASEPREWRRKAAVSLGITAVAPDELSACVADTTEGRGAPVLVEASGRPSTLAAGLGLLAHEGTALVASWYGTTQAVLPLGADFHRRRLSIRSTQVSTIPARLGHRWTMERRRAAVRALLGELPLAELATHEFPLDAAQDAFRAVDQGEEGLIHAALTYT